MVTRPRPAVLRAAMRFPETAHANGFPEVDVSGYGGGAGVEPVLVGIESSELEAWRQDSDENEKKKGRKKNQSID